MGPLCGSIILCLGLAICQDCPAAPTQTTQVKNYLWKHRGFLQNYRKQWKSHDAMGPLCGSIILCLGLAICQDCPAAPTQTTQVKNYLWKHRGFLQNYRKQWKSHDAMGPLCGSIILCLGPTICQNCPAAPTQTTQVKNYLWKHRGFLQNCRKPWKSHDAMGPLCGSIILCLGLAICQDCPAAPTQTTQVKNYLWKHRGFLQNYRKPWKKQ
jgi:preprotein translocase subunit Sss1